MSHLASERIGVVVGLAAEARIACRFGCPVAIGGGSSAGAEAAARRLIEQGATALISFGLAGGLDPLVRPGTVIVPEAVCTRGARIPTDAGLNARIGGVTPHMVLGADRFAVSADAKQRLWVASGCAAIDMESGAVGLTADAFGIPFAILRAICDPAERDLPPAALIALDKAGAIGLARVIASVMGAPRQLPALRRLACDAAIARHALLRRTNALARIGP